MIVSVNHRTMRHLKRPEDVSSRLGTKVTDGLDALISSVSSKNILAPLETVSTSLIQDRMRAFGVSQIEYKHLDSPAAWKHAADLSQAMNLVDTGKTMNWGSVIAGRYHKLIQELRYHEAYAHMDDIGVYIAEKLEHKAVSGALNATRGCLFSADQERHYALAMKYAWDVSATFLWFTSLAGYETITGEGPFHGLIDVWGEGVWPVGFENEKFIVYILPTKPQFPEYV
jgi:hypothetical protein